MGNGLRTDITEANSVLLVLHPHGKVTVQVSDSRLNDTSIAVNLANSGTHHGAHFIAYISMDRGYCLCTDGYCRHQRKYHDE